MRKSALYITRTCYLFIFYAFQTAKPSPSFEDYFRDTVISTKASTSIQNRRARAFQFIPNLKNKFKNLKIGGKDKQRDGSTFTTTTSKNRIESSKKSKLSKKNKTFIATEFIPAPVNLMYRTVTKEEGNRNDLFNLSPNKKAEKVMKNSNDVKTSSTPHVPPSIKSKELRCRKPPLKGSARLSFAPIKRPHGKWKTRVYLKPVDTTRRYDDMDLTMDDKTMDWTTPKKINVDWMKKLEQNALDPTDFNTEATLNFIEQSNNFNDIKMKKHRGTTIKRNTFTTRLHINKKREVESEVFTAKDVAGLDVVVDLIKSNDEKDVANALPNNVLLQQSVTRPRDSTSTIQVHIAIPFDPTSKKRSPGQVRVRKVFSAKMSVPVDLEYQIHSFEDVETTTSYSTEAFSDEGLSPGMYLLVDKPKNKYELKPVNANINFKEIKLRKAEPTAAINSVDTTTKEDIKNVTLRQSLLKAVNRQLAALYANLTKTSSESPRQRRKRYTKSMDVRRLRKYPLKTMNYRIKRGIDWDAVKKFFGHDRVCDCKCRENRTMCRACAASDAVIDELIFEFDNLERYMKDHCTEIQTYFWMNPSGGKKLREAVRKVDKSLQDYYKRVKGKCKGKTCKTLTNTYIDKRRFADNLEIVEQGTGHDFLKDLIDIGNDLDKLIEMKTCVRPKLYAAGTKMIFATNSCVSVVMKPIIKRSDHEIKNKLVKNVYSLDNINVNIVCKTDRRNVDESHKDELQNNLKKRRGFKHFFPKRNKKKKFCTYSGTEDPNFKAHFKREANGGKHIESPLISDSGGSFWYDYIKAGSTKPQLPKQTEQFIIVPKLDLSIVKVKDSIKKDVTTQLFLSTLNDIKYMNKNSNRSTMFLQSIAGKTDKSNVSNEKPSPVKSVTIQPQKNNSTLKELKSSSNKTTEAKYVSLFEVMQKHFHGLNNCRITGSNLTDPTTPKPTAKMSILQELEQLIDEYSGTKTTHQPEHLKESASKAMSISDDIKDLENKILAITRKYYDNEIDTPRTTMESVSATIEDIEKSLHDKINKHFPRIQSEPLTERPIGGQNETKDNKYQTKSKQKKITTKKTNKSKGRKNKMKSKTNKAKAKTTNIWHPSLHNTTTQKNYLPKLSDKNELPQLKKGPYTSKSLTPKTLDTLTTLPPMGIDSTKSTKTTTKRNEGFFQQLKSATLSFFGIRKTTVPASNKVKESYAPQVIRPVDLEEDLHFNELEGVTEATIDTPIVINDGHTQAVSKKYKDYKSLLLSIIQFETNKLNEEWHRIAYGTDDTWSNDSSITSDSPQDVTGEPKYEMPQDIPAAQHDKGRTTEAHTKKAKMTTSKNNGIILKIEASDSYPAPRTVCDLQATLDHVLNLQSKLTHKKFQDYVKNITCHKRRRMKNNFYIKERNTSLQWNWIRNKRFTSYCNVYPGHRYFLNVEKISDEDVILQRNGKSLDEDNRNINIDKFVYRGNEFNSEEFETFLKGKGGVYKIEYNRRKRDTVKTLAHTLSPLTTTESEIYVMAGESTILYCQDPRSSDPDARYTWQSERPDMMDQNNVKMHGYRMVLKKTGPKNDGRYSCYRNKEFCRDMYVKIVALPEYDIVFLPTYRTQKECSYVHLRAIQHLDRLMTKEALCGDVCSIRLNEPVCQRDKITNTSSLRSTAVLTLSALPIKCSVQCRRDVLASFVRLAAGNAGALMEANVVISKDGVNETLKPTKDVATSLVTHVLRKKDSRNVREYRKLTSAMNPGTVQTIAICGAGYYLLQDPEICVPCPPNTRSSRGDNSCTACPRGSASDVGAVRCNSTFTRLRRYQWWWFPPCGYLVASVAVVCACGVCVVVSSLMHLLSRGAQGRRAGAGKAKQKHHIRYAHSTRGGPLSPSRVILARFFKPSLTSSRATDSQETKFEIWKGKNNPPPLPPVDFEIDTS